MASGQDEVVLRQFRRLFGPGGVAGLSEGQLLDRFAADGDPAAFEALVARHGPMVLGVCRRMLRDPNDADDAFQATFLVLVRRAGAIRDGEKLSSWLHGVAIRVASRVRARSARTRDREQPGADLAAIPPADFDAREDRRLLDEELGRLPEKYRSPIVLCYLEGRTHEEAARHLRWPVGTVKGRLSRARDLLRSRLARRGVVASSAALVAALARESSAAIPESLAESTLRAASRFAKARATAGAVSASSTLLAEGVLKTMLWTQTKTAAAAALLTLGVVAAGAGVLAQGEKKAEDARDDGPPSAEAGASARHEAPRGDLAKIRGTWRLISEPPGGRALPLPSLVLGGGKTKLPEDDQRRAVLITSDALVAWGDSGPESATFTLDPTKDPKTIDLVPSGGPRKGETFPGIYRFDGDTLTIKSTTPEGQRPRDFDAPDAPPLNRWTYRRVEEIGHPRSAVSAVRPGAAVEAPPLINDHPPAGAPAAVVAEPSPSLEPVPAGLPPTPATAPSPTLAAVQPPAPQPVPEPVDPGPAPVGLPLPPSPGIPAPPRLPEPVPAPDAPRAEPALPLSPLPLATTREIEARPVPEDLQPAPQPEAHPVQATGPRMPRPRRAEDLPTVEVRAASPRELAVQLRRALAEFRRQEELAKRGVLSMNEVHRSYGVVDLCKAQIEARLEESESDLEILKSQLAAKMARLKKAEAQRQVAVTDQTRLETIKKKGNAFVSLAEIQKAEAEVNTAEAQCEVERAEIAEHELRIKRMQRLVEEFKELAEANAR